MSAPKKLAIAITVIALTVTAGRNLYRFYFCPEEYEGSAVFYSGTVLEYKNTVARKNTETGLRLEWIGTVDSVAPDTEMPDSDFECNDSILMKSKLYSDDYGRYYLYCSNGDLLMLETAPQKNNYELRITERGLSFARKKEKNPSGCRKGCGGIRQQPLSSLLGYDG